MKPQPTTVLTALLVATGLSAPIAAQASPGLAQVVRAATQPYLNVAKAENPGGYGQFLGCTSDQDGSMGIHYANGSLVGDGALDARHPEVLMYEPMADGSKRLIGAEFIVLVQDWEANHSAPPVLMGQLFHYEDSPNRYGLPPFYALHVWAWKTNPSGTFADWNPTVRCDYAR
jgi:hypothetical protein